MEGFNMTHGYDTTLSGSQSRDPSIDPIHAAGTALGGIHNPFWMNFDPPPYQAHLIVGILITCVGTIAVTGNLLVIVIFLRFRSLRTPGNVLIINLAIVDMMMASTNCPFYAISSFCAKWAFSDNVCVLYGFCGAMFGLLSINTIAAVSLDRYLVITRTTGVSRSKNPRQTYCMLLIAWFNSLIWSIPPLLGWNRYALEGFQTSCSFDYLTPTRNYRSLVVSMCLCGFVIPLFIIIFCYAYIYNTVHTHECTFRATSKRLEAKVILGGRERLYSTELRMVKTAMLVLLFYLISWMPYAVVSLMGVFGYSHYLKPLSSVIPGIMAKMSSIYNPFIYTISHHRFRKKLRMLFSRNSDIRHLSSSLSIEMGRIFNDSNDTDTSPSQVFTRSPTVRGHYRATSSQDAKHLRGSCRTAFNRRSKSPRKSINRKSEYRAVSQISESENNNHAPKPNQTQTNDYKAIVIPSFVSPVKKSPLKLSKTVSNWFGPYEAISLSILPGSPEHRCAPLRRSHSDDTGFRTQPLDLGNPDEKEPLTRDLPTPKVPKSLTIVIDFRHLDPKTSTVV